MISKAIMINTVGIKQVEDRTLDSVGCATETTYTETVELPAYVTETSYSEISGGSQPNVAALICYINYNAAITAVDKSWVVEFEDADYSILNVDWTFDKRHVELILTRVEGK